MFLFYKKVNKNIRNLWIYLNGGMIFLRILLNMFNK